MKDIDKIKAGIIVFCIVIFVVSFVTGQSIDNNLFRWLSGASSLVILIYFIYEKWIWKWPIIRIYAEQNGIPVLYGTWKGVLKYESDATGKPGEIDIYVSVNQTLSTISIETFVETSTSYSITAKIEKSQSGKLQLIYFYRSEAPYGKRDQNRPHDGACVLDIIGIPVNQLKGSYFTERKGAGIIELKNHSNQLAQTLEEAKSLNYD